EPAVRRRMSFYSQVADRLTKLMAIVGVEESAAQIRRTFALLCSESLAPHGDRMARESRLNADGTPFQFACMLVSPPSLQFLSEPARANASNTERLDAAHEHIEALLPLFSIDDAAEVHSCLDRIVPAEDPELAVDHAGPIWLGAGFAPLSPPRLKIYMNTKWGSPRDRWKRIDALADWVGASSEWRALRPLLHNALQPLGVSLTLCRFAPPEQRVYFHAPEMTFADHETQAVAVGSIGVGARLAAFRAQLLSEDAAFAMRSAVCSFGLQRRAVPSFKLELCAHCAFASDAVARARCRRWLEGEGFDATQYCRVVDALAVGPLSTQDTRLHSFVGMAERRGLAHPTMYFNP